MRRRTSRIRKIVALADMEEQKVVQALGQSRQRLEHHLSRLGELSAYRQSYAEKVREVSAISPVRWRDYQAFLAKLDHAVTAQRQLIVDGERNIELHRNRWLARRQRVESLRRVMDRYVRDDRIADDNATQRELDDQPRPDGVFPGDSET